MNKHLKIGPGGRKCACCFPSPGSKERKQLYRAAKRKEKKLALMFEITDFHHLETQMKPNSSAS